MTISTKATAVVRIEIDLGCDAWSEDEPGLGRAFEYAERQARIKIGRIIKGERLKGDAESVRSLAIDEVRLTVGRRK